MKKVFKSTFIYLGVILLAFIATIIFCAAFLFFYRDGNIFGIQYVSSKQVLYAQTSVDLSGMQSIEIESDGYDITIGANSNVKTLVGAMRNKVFGFARKSQAQPSFKLKYNPDTKAAVFAVKEPEGFLNKSDAKIEIAIPKAWVNNKYDFNIKTNKGDVVFGGELDCSAGEIDFVSKKGDVSVENIDLFGEVNIDIGSGEFVIDDKCACATAVDINIKLGSGKVNLGQISVDNLTFGTINVKKIERGEIWILKAEELISNDSKNILGGGEILVQEVKFVDFASRDTNVEIGRIAINLEDNDGNEIPSRIEISGQGGVKVNTANCGLIINGYNGDIKVGSANGKLVLNSNQGDIKVSSGLKAVAAESRYGNIDITFSSGAGDYDLVNEARSVIATTSKGHIIVNGLQKGFITATDSGRITLKYNKVVGENVVNAKAGVVNVVVPHPGDTDGNKYAFNLKVGSEVNTDVKVGAAGSIGRAECDTSGVHEFVNIYNSASSTANNLTILSTTGKIKIRSADLVGF